MIILCLLTVNASKDKASNIILDPRPRKILTNLSKSLSYPHMASCQCWMVFLKESFNKTEPFQKPNVALLNNKILQNDTIWIILRVSFYALSESHIIRMKLQLCFQFLQKNEMRNNYHQQFSDRSCWNPGEGISSNVVFPGVILNGVVIPHQSSEIELLFRHLNHLQHQLFQTPVIC